MPLPPAAAQPIPPRLAKCRGEGTQQPCQPGLQPSATAHCCLTAEGNCTTYKGRDSFTFWKLLGQALQPLFSENKYTKFPLTVAWPRVWAEESTQPWRKKHALAGQYRICRRSSHVTMPTQNGQDEEALGCHGNATGRLSFPIQVGKHQGNKCQPLGQHCGTPSWLSHCPRRLHPMSSSLLTHLGGQQMMFQALGALPLQ